MKWFVSVKFHRDKALNTQKKTQRHLNSFSVVPTRHRRSFSASFFAKIKNVRLFHAVSTANATRYIARSLGMRIRVNLDDLSLKRLPRFGNRSHAVLR